MAKSKSTIRKMTNQPITRELAKLDRELTAMSRHLSVMIDKVQRLEIDSIALWNQGVTLGKYPPELHAEPPKPEPSEDSFLVSEE